jgi:hypothetical protein
MAMCLLRKLTRRSCSVLHAVAPQKHEEASVLLFALRLHSHAQLSQTATSLFLQSKSLFRDWTLK